MSATPPADRARTAVVPVPAPPPGAYRPAAPGANDAPVVLVWEADDARRRAWMGWLREAGFGVRGAAREAERAKALADGVVRVCVTSAPPVPAAPAPVSWLVLPPEGTATGLVAAVRAALAVPETMDGG